MKKNLACKLTALFYGNDIGLKEKQSFSNVFTQGENPEEMNQISVSKNSLSKDTSILEILFASQIFSSKGQIRRLIEQGAVKVDGAES